MRGMCIDTIKSFYRKSCLVIHHILLKPFGVNAKFRAAIGFLVGPSMAFLFYVTMLINLDLEPNMTIAFGSIVGIILSTGCALSIQVRCVCLLTIPAFLGRAGRSLLRALILGYIIAGPIFNLTYNGREVIRTFACTSQLTHNLSKTRFDLMFQPLQQALHSMRESPINIDDTFSNVRDLINPIVEEMEGQDETTSIYQDNDYVQTIRNLSKIDVISVKLEKRDVANKSLRGFEEMRYRRKIETRCETQLSSGSERCRNMFHEMYDKCYISVTWVAAWILCWPMKLTFICNIVQSLGGSRICDSRDKIDFGIDNGYAALKDTRSELGGDMKGAWIQYKMNKQSAVLRVRGARDTIQAVVHEFNIRRDLINATMTLLKRCLALVFLKIIHNAQQYHDRFLTDIEHDNNYVTSYFHKIDARRKARGSSYILPLRKNERTILNDSSWTAMPNLLEKRYLIGQIIKLILEMAAATTIILLDQLLFDTLDLIKTYGYVEYNQTGHHNINLDIYGTGIVASLIKDVIRGFNLKKNVKMAVSNGTCLPLPNGLNYHVLIKIYGTYGVVMIMLFMSSYTQRLRRKICEYFYVRRKKRRILYLYNETIRRRLGYNKFMKDKVTNLVKQQHSEVFMNPRVAALILSSRWFGWLRFFEIFRRKCLICRETEPRRKSNFRTCTTRGCPYIHCSECWQDIGRICLACINSSQSKSNSNHNN